MDLFGSIIGADLLVYLELGVVITVVFKLGTGRQIVDWLCFSQSAACLAMLRSQQVIYEASIMTLADSVSSTDAEINFFWLPELPSGQHPPVFRLSGSGALI